MAEQKPPGDTTADKFALSVDDSLLEAAVAAVEKHTRRPDSPAEFVPVEIEVEGDDPDDVDDPDEDEAITTRTALSELAEEFVIEIGLGEVGAGPGADSSEREAPSHSAPEDAQDRPDVPDDAVADGSVSATNEAESSASPSPPDDAGQEVGMHFTVLAEEWERLQLRVQEVDAERELLRTEAQAAEDSRLRQEAQVHRLNDRVRTLERDLRSARDERRDYQQQITSLRDGLARAERHIAGIQERRRRELEEQRLHGHGGAVLEILPVVDHLQLALSHAEADATQVVEGVRMVLMQFTQALARLGVERIDAETGSIFRPEVHEAMMNVVSDSARPGQVVEELSAGYIINGRLLRAARVTVCAVPPATEAEPAADASTDEEPSSLPKGDNTDEAEAAGPASTKPGVAVDATDEAAAPSAPPSEDAPEDAPEDEDEPEDDVAIENVVVAELKEEVLFDNDSDDSEASDRGGTDGPEGASLDSERPGDDPGPPLHAAVIDAEDWKDAFEWSAPDPALVSDGQLGQQPEQETPGRDGSTVETLAEDLEDLDEIDVDISDLAADATSLVDDPFDQSDGVPAWQGFNLDEQDKDIPPPTGRAKRSGARSGGKHSPVDPSTTSGDE